MKKTFLLILITFFSELHSENYQISTSSGLTEGIKKNKVIVWEDIPYAQPPINNLRWKAPRKIIENSVKIKPKNGNFCIQRTSSLGGSSQYSNEFISGSEDCLYLDIYSPSNNTNDLLPVMFWIHGGGNTSGLKDIYDFSKLVKKHNVIVVRINYRLGPFGWFTHPSIQELQNGLDKTSNFGTLDIIAALEWTHQNINLFKGDPNNITIFGESAGGHNVLSLLVSKQAKGLFHKAISMSGYTESISIDDAYLQRKKSSTSDYSSNEVVKKIINDDKKYEKSQSQYSMQDLRDILYSLSGKDFYKYYADRESFEEIPLLTNDGIVIPTIGLERALSNEEYVNKVPTILGSNRDEVKLWLAFSEYFVTTDRSISGSIFNIPRVVLKDKDAYEAFNYYRSSAWKIRGVDKPLRSLSKAGNSKLYSYRYDWDDHRKFLIADFKELIGAAHATEIPLLAGDDSLVGGTPVANFIYPKGISKFFTSRNMMLFWTNFAKNGDPGYSSNNIKWERYTPENPNVFMVLDKKKYLKMVSNNISFKSLSDELFIDERLNEIEKCVVLYQMYTFVGNDIYDQNVKDYPGKCNRNISEEFIIKNASVIDYE